MQPKRRACVLALLGLWVSTVSAGEAGWLNLYPPTLPAAADADGLQVALDVTSIPRSVLGHEASLRLGNPQGKWTHDSGIQFGSLETVLRIHCSTGTMEPIAASYYEGGGHSGAALLHETNLSADGVSPQIVRLVPVYARDKLLKVVCSGA